MLSSERYRVYRHSNAEPCVVDGYVMFLRARAGTEPVDKKETGDTALLISPYARFSQPGEI